MKIGYYSLDEYEKLVKSFHGSLAPGLLIGGFMVDLAQKNLPQGEFFDTICETSSCLPDAVQLLTPCSTGNGWMKVIDFGRFAISFYEKKTGEGIRVFLDLDKLKNCSEVYSWFMKLKPKREQDSNLLMNQIKEAGAEILSIRKIRIDPALFEKKKGGASAVCPVCKEAYPAGHGDKCRNCAGESPYLEVAEM
ncbi:MAG TPA: formylmethanofuran dehydrogenase subunit E family protein [Spirochaetota bacterium]|nr:formylmethanofuran dehydrogenase subunit E family protein [Spirochaetota bacterium]